MAHLPALHETEGLTPSRVSRKQVLFYYILIHSGKGNMVKTARRKFYHLIYAILTSPAPCWLYPAHPGSKTTLLFPKACYQWGKMRGLQPKSSPW